CDRLTTAAAAANLIGLRRQLQHQPATLSTPLMPPILDPIPHPATELGNTIPVGHGRPQFVALDISKSAGSAVRLSLSWEKNQKEGPLARAFFRIWCSLRDSNPCFSLERATS